MKWEEEKKRKKGIKMEVSETGWKEKKRGEKMTSEMKKGEEQEGKRWGKK